MAFFYSPIFNLVSNTCHLNLLFIFFFCVYTQFLIMISLKSYLVGVYFLFIFNTMQYFWTLFIYIFLPPTLHFSKKLLKICKNWSTTHLLYLLILLTCEIRYSPKRHFFTHHFFIWWVMRCWQFKTIQHYSLLKT